MLLQGTKNKPHTSTHNSLQDKSKIPELFKLLPVSEIVNRLKVTSKQATAEPPKKQQKQAQAAPTSQPQEKKGKQEAKPQAASAAASAGGAYDDFSKCQLQVSSATKHDYWMQFLNANPVLAHANTQTRKHATPHVWRTLLGQTFPHHLL